MNKIVTLALVFLGGYFLTGAVADAIVWQGIVGGIALSAGSFAHGYYAGKEEQRR